MEEVKVQIRFTIERDGRAFTDALYMPIEEYQNTPQETIEAMKEERFSNWISSLEAAQNAPQDEPPQDEVLDNEAPIDEVPKEE